MSETIESRAALERAIDEHPDQASNYLVLADHLQEHGDPRGEWIVRWRDANDAQRNQLARQLETALGPRPPQYGSLSWCYGFVRDLRAIVDDDDAGVLATILAHPSLRHVQRIHLEVAGGLYDDDLRWVVGVLAASVRPSLRELVLKCYVRGGNEPPRGALDLSPLWSAMPRLHTLRATARQITPGSLAAPTLEILELDGAVASDAIEPLFAGATPKLRELHLHDIQPALATRIEQSALADQLEKGTLMTADRDRYVQTGE